MYGDRTYFPVGILEALELALLYLIPVIQATHIKYNRGAVLMHKTLVQWLSRQP